MATHRTIRDITRSNARPLDDVDPELVVINVEHGKSYVPLNVNHSTRQFSAEMDETLRTRLSQGLGLNLLDISGWGNGMRLPFANRENQDLEKLLEFKQRKYLVLQTEISDNADHLNMLEQNFSRASEDITTYQNFLASKKKQIEEEKNLTGLAERFYNSLMQEKLKTEKTLKECNERCNRMQVNQDRRLQNLCELRDLIEFDREALRDYHERLKSYQTQKFELGRIIKEDSKTIDEIDKTCAEMGSRKKILKMELDQQAMTTSKCQEQLDRLSVEFRKVYRHRQEMITLWSTNIENAKKKDAQMNDIADDYFECKEKFRDINSEMEFRERQYRSVQCGIRNVQLHVSELDKKLAEQRRVMQLEKDLIIELKDNVLEVKQDIRAGSIEEKNVHLRAAKLSSEMSAIEDKLRKLRIVVENLRKKTEDVRSLRYTSDQHINELEKILDAQEKRGDEVLREMELTRKFFWERANDKKNIEDEIVHLEMSLHRIKSNLSSLEAKEFTNMEFLAKQSAKVYRLDLETSTLENKISRAQSEAVNPQYFVLQTRVAQFREESRDVCEERKYILKELTNLAFLISKGSTELVKNKEEKVRQNKELLEINMVSQRTQKLIDHSDKTIQNMQVENSLESVNLKRLTDAVKLSREQLFGLSEERDTIYWAVSERKAEIQNHRCLNLTKSKALLDAVNKLKVQVHEMDGRTNKLKGRFDLVSKMMTGSQETGTEEDTIGYKVRKAARERESLQLELRRWEARVEEGKHELTGLQNVQKLLQASNMAVKDTLAPIKEGSSESQELELLNHEEKSIHVRKSRAQRFKVVLFDKIEDLKQQIAVMEQETQATSQLSSVKATMASRTENELHRQKEKIQRWTSLCSKLLKELRNVIHRDDFEFLQEDLKLRILHEKLDCAFTMLERLLAAFPNNKQTVQEFFDTDQNLTGLIHRVIKPVAASVAVSNRVLGRPFPTMGRKSLIRQSNPQAGTNKKGKQIDSMDTDERRKSSKMTDESSISISDEFSDISVGSLDSF